MFNINESRQWQKQFCSCYYSGHYLIRRFWIQSSFEGRCITEASNVVVVTGDNTQRLFITRFDDQFNLFAHRYIHFSPDITNGPDYIHQQVHFCYRLWVLQSSIILRPSSKGNRLSFMRQVLPDFFRNKRHKRMNQAHCAV
ncbi:hypothetical protein D3C78_889440 [compost metagenome]